MRKLGLIVLAIFFLAGCGTTFPEQIRNQGGTPLDINRAAYAQALIWYNDNQEAFTRQVVNFEPAVRLAVKDKIVEINGLLNDMADILNQWRDANVLLEMDMASEQWIAARNRLIDAGLTFLTKRP